MASAGQLGSWLEGRCGDKEPALVAYISLYYSVRDECGVRAP